MASYTAHNFQPNELITSQHVNEIDAQVVRNMNKISELTEQGHDSSQALERIFVDDVTGLIIRFPPAAST